MLEMLTDSFGFIVLVSLGDECCDLGWSTHSFFVVVCVSTDPSVYKVVEFMVCGELTTSDHSVIISLIMNGC